MSMMLCNDMVFVNRSQQIENANYRIVPNRRAVHKCEGLGVHLLISQKWAG